MSFFLTFGLGFCAFALIFIAANLWLLLRRASALRRRASVLRSHPTLIALQRAQALAADMSGVPVSLAAIRARSARILGSVTKLGAASSRLRLNVDRISFATRLLLETFVPALRGSMAD